MAVTLLSPSLLRYAALQRSSTRGNAALQRNVAFFATLHCNVMLPSSLRCAAAQLHKNIANKNKQNKQTRKKSKDVYLGPVWVPLRLQPQVPCSNNSNLQAPTAPSSKVQALAPAPTASAPAPSSLPLDVSGALAME
jgi:hypothetical protein